MSAYIEGYEYKTIYMKNVSGRGRLEFVQEIINAVKDGFDICDSSTIAPEGFSNNLTVPLFVGGKCRVVLYKAINIKPKTKKTASPKKVTPRKKESK